MTPSSVITSQARAWAPRLWSMCLKTAILSVNSSWASVWSTETVETEPQDRFPLLASSLYRPQSLGCCVFQWPGCSLHSGFGMAASNWRLAGSYRCLLWRPSRLVNEGWSITAKWLWTCIFPTLKAEVVDRWNTIFNSVAQYNRLLKAGASANDFFHKSGFFGKETSEQPRQVVYGTSRRDVQPLLWWKRRLVIDREQGTRMHRQERSQRNKGEIHIHFQHPHWIYEREQNGVDSKAPCSTGLVVSMADVCEGPEWLLLSYYVHEEEVRALPTEW